MLGSSEIAGGVVAAAAVARSCEGVGSSGSLGTAAGARIVSSPVVSDMTSGAASTMARTRNGYAAVRAAAGGRGSSRASIVSPAATRSFSGSSYHVRSRPPRASEYSVSRVPTLRTASRSSVVASPPPSRLTSLGVSANPGARGR